MCSLSEMKRYVECMAYSRRVRVQIKEKGMEERDGMVFYIYCLCTHYHDCQMLHNHPSFDHTNTQKLLTSYEEQKTIDRYFHFAILIIKR